MSTVFKDRSSDTDRSDRDVILTETTTVGDQFYAARSLWADADTPPQTGTTRAWAES
jgi:hypothetical protein